MGERQMKRLVTQFDEQRRRATAATPTCGGGCCCCCCCCLASILTSTAVTVLNVSDAAVQRNVPQPMRAVYLLAAFAVLPTAAVLGIGVGVGSGVSGRGALVAGVAVGIVIWSGLLASIYGWLGLGVGRRARVIAITVISGPLLFVGELIGGIWLFLAHTDEYGSPSGAGPAVYMTLVFLLPFLLVPLLRTAMGMRQGRSLRAILFERGPGGEHWPPRT